MTNIETWTATRERLVHLGATDEQMEAVRRAGARRRHEARVESARVALDQLVAGICLPAAEDPDRQAIRALVREAITRALGCVGMPGSACGSSPPGWLAGGPSADARIAAWQYALDAWPVGLSSGLTHYVTASEGCVVVMRAADDAPVGVVYSDESALSDAEQRDALSPVLAEHLLAVSVWQAALAVDTWLVQGASGPMPPLPDASAAAELERIICTRRYGAARRHLVVGGAMSEAP